MSTALDRLCSQRQADVEIAKANHPLSEIEARAKQAAPARGFASALSDKAAAGHAIIAELKKASPSAGLIRADFAPDTLAEAYQAGGAACLSVLTEPHEFLGADVFLEQAKAAVPLPALRKDFMVDLYQVPESRALGADCILLILAQLDDGLAAEMTASANDWGMDVLVEVHTQAEMQRALDLKAPLIGINNRDLKTLKVDTATTPRLAAMAPDPAMIVAESGLKDRATLDELADTGVKRFLIGESLMRQADVTAALKTLTQVPAHV